MKYGISRKEEAELPSFKNHDEARRFFKERYGDSFQMYDSDDSHEPKIYFYRLILNKEAYIEMNNELIENGFCVMTEEKAYCTQDIQIFEDGRIHIVH